MSSPSTIGIGIVGYGARGRSLEQTIRTGLPGRAVVVGFCESNPVRYRQAEHWAREQSGVVESDLDRFLAHNGIDLVMICTPQFAHEQVACRALSAGRDVFLEKPMARTVAECDRILEARDRSGRELFIGFNLRRYPTCRKIKEIIAAGTIGRPQSVVCTHFYAAGMTYFRRWHRLRENSGGLIVEKGCHTFDLINWYMDSAPVTVAAFGGLDVYGPRPDAAIRCRDCPRAATCHYYRKVDSTDAEDNAGDPEDLCVYNSEKDTFDNHMAIIEYANNCRAAYIESFVSRVSAKSGGQFVINGPEGQIWASLHDRVVKVYKTHALDTLEGPVDEYRFPQESGGHGGADLRLMDHILTCMRERSNPVLTGEAGRAAVLIAEAAEVATDQRRMVDIRSGRIE